MAARVVTTGPQGRRRGQGRMGTTDRSRETARRVAGDAEVGRPSGGAARSRRGAANGGSGSLWEHYEVALAVARQKYPGLSGEDHLDIVQEAMTNVLARLRQGPLADERSYLLRVVYTCGAQVLRGRMRPTVSLDHETGSDAVEAQVDRASAPVSAEEQVLRAAEVAAVRRIIERELTGEEAAALLMRTVDRMAPAEIAEAMGWTRRRYRKLLERAGRKLSVGLERERGRELLVLYAAGLASEGERLAAEALMETEDGARLFASIQARLDAAAALVPWPLVLEAAAPNGREGRPVVRLAETLHEGVQRVADGLKSVALNALGRLPGVDLAAAAQVGSSGGLRGSGAVVAAAVVCLGGTYCAAKTLPGDGERPVRVARHGAAHERPRPPRTPEHVAAVVPVRGPAVVRSMRTSAVRRRARPAPAATSRSVSAARASAGRASATIATGEVEFGIEAPSAAPAGSQATARLAAGVPVAPTAAVARVDRASSEPFGASAAAPASSTPAPRAPARSASVRAAASCEFGVEAC